MNPFLIPGCEDDPHAPINPGKRGTELDYVGVDETAEAFEQFIREIGDVQKLIPKGRLVIVTGQPCCGKTALINRCIHWITSNVDPEHYVLDVDLRRDARPDQSIADRMSVVCTRLLDELSSRKALSGAGWLADLRGQPERVYPMLHRALGAKTLVVVVLPPSADLIGELVEYARLTRPGVLLFAETSFVRKVDNRRGELQRAGDPPPLFLGVGPLRLTDGKLYADTRFARLTVDIPPPPIAPGTLERLALDREISIGELQRMLFGVYEDVLRRDTPPAMVTYEDILQYWWRSTAPGGED